MLKKTMLILLAVLLAALMLVGCGQTDSTDSGSKDSPKASDTAGKDTSASNTPAASSTPEASPDVSPSEPASDETTDETTSDAAPADESDSSSDAKLDFTITPADGWTPVDISDTITLWEYQSENGANLDLIEDYLPDGITTAMDLANYEFKDLKDVFPDAEYYEPDAAIVGNVEGAYMRMSMDWTDGSTQYTDYAYFIKDGKGYRLEGISYSNDEQGTQDIGDMIDGMTIN